MVGHSSGLDHVAAFGAVELLSFLSSADPRATVRQVGPVTSVLTGAPGYGVNVIVVLGPPAAAESILEGELSLIGPDDGPVQVAFRCSERTGRRLRAMTRRLHLRPLTEHRAMVHSDPLSLQAPPSNGLAVSLVQDPDALSRHVAVMAESFGMDRPGAARLFPESLLSEDRVQFFNGAVAGRTVATAAALRADRLASINNIGVVSHQRNRGLGTAMTVAAMSWATSVGAEKLVLDATASGARLYRRLGFEEVDLVRFFQRKIPR